MKRIQIISTMFFLFFIKLSFSNTVIVFVDNTRNLDYFVNGKMYKVKNDIKELINEYNKDSYDRLILVDVRKYNTKKVRGKVYVIGGGEKIIKRFNSKVLLKKNSFAKSNFKS